MNVLRSIRVSAFNWQIPEIDSDGNFYWYINGKLHREDGPAIEYADGSKAWFINGNRHRENGPAVEYADGTKAWYINGSKLTEKEFRESIN